MHTGDYLTTLKSRPVLIPDSDPGRPGASGTHSTAARRGAVGTELPCVCFLPTKERTTKETDRRTDRERERASERERERERERAHGCLTEHPAPTKGCAAAVVPPPNPSPPPPHTHTLPPRPKQCGAVQLFVHVQQVAVVLVQGDGGMRGGELSLRGLVGVLIYLLANVCDTPNMMWPCSSSKVTKHIPKGRFVLCIRSKTLNTCIRHTTSIKARQGGQHAVIINV